MEINKLVCLRGEKAEQWCLYLGCWHGIPVFVTKDEKDAKSALYQDGTCFIVVGATLARFGKTLFLNRLWHEVSHLYFADVWKPWDMRYEYRADLVAAAATGRDATLERLSAMLTACTNPAADRLIRLRLFNLMTCEKPYSPDDVSCMLKALKPVTVLT
ncbi:hypothetical protein AAFA46_03145 [Oscillospiraceae bacterium WX1]